MLFTLHADFGALTRAEWEGHRAELTNILMAHKHGHHFFLPDRRVLDTLLQCPILGDVCLATLSEIKNKFVDINSLRVRVRRIVVIGDPQRGHVTHETDIERSLDIRLLADPQFLAPFQLVVENIEGDGQFWKRIFEIISQKELGKFALPEFELYQGGGTGIGASLRYLAGRKSAFFCIVDSDKRSPYAPNGDTAKTARRAMIETGMVHHSDAGLSSVKHHTGIRVLDVREIENFVPLNTMESILDELHSPNFAIVRQVVPSQPNLNEEDKTIWAFYDVKGAQQMPAAFCSAEEKVYFEEIERRSGTPFRGIREHIITDLLQYLQGRQSSQRNREFSKSLIDGPFAEHLSEIFWDVFSLGCAPQVRWF